MAYDTRRVIKKPVEIQPVSPEKQTSSSNVVLEYVYPIVNNPDNPHKQYVNLPSNNKESGIELTIRVKPKNLKADIKKVYWKVTAGAENSKRNDPKTGIKKDKSSALVEFNSGLANLETEYVEREASIILSCGLAGGDRFTVEVGSDGETFPLKVVVENWRRLWYQLTHHEKLGMA